MTDPGWRAFGPGIPWGAAIFAVLIHLAACSGGTGEEKVLLNGVAELREHDFSLRGTVRLVGLWHLWAGELLSPGEVQLRIREASGSFIPQPGVWSKITLLQDPEALVSTGTVALRLMLPAGIDRWALRVPNAHSALKVFAGSELIGEIGRVGTSAGDHVPSNQLKILRFFHPGGEILLTLQVSNFNLPHTGTWDPILLGPEQEVLDKRHWDLVVTSLIAGALIFIGFYHLVLWVLRREDLTPLWFGIICLLMALRNLLMGERILVYLFPADPLSWEIIARMIHLSAHLSVPFFYLYFRGIFPELFPRKGIWLTSGAALLWAAVEVFTPTVLHHQLLFLYEIFLLATAFFAFYGISQALLRKEPGAGLTLGGFGVVVFTTLNDILLSAGWIQSFYMASLGVFLYTFSQSYLLSWRSAQLYRMVALYSDHLEKLNQSLERFIPHEVLKFLEKKSIVEVELGDFSERTMTVFFLDIRDFTSLSESISPQDNFRFINTFLRKVGPLVREHGGFVDKYLGDGFMALFPHDSDQALKAALEIRRRLQDFNGVREAKGRRTIRVGIGIHTGPLMLGTIGENRRMDSTVISDTVNIASRLEQMTKELKVDILVSAQTVDSLAVPENFRLVPAGDKPVKGRSGLISVYQVEALDRAPS